MGKNIYDLIETGKKNFVPHLLMDICDDYIAATVLSQILYWFKPDKDGKSKIRIERDGKAWLAKSSRQFAEELNLDDQRINRAVARLKKRGFIETAKHKFLNSPTIHYRPIFEAINSAAEAALNEKTTEESAPSSEREAPPGVAVASSMAAVEGVIPSPAAALPSITARPPSAKAGSRRKRNRINDNPLKPPEVSEVAEFFRTPEMRNAFNWNPNFTPEDEAEKLCDYYENTGWIHSGGKIVTDWEVCARSWPNTAKEIFEQMGRNRNAYISRWGKNPSVSEKEMWLDAAAEISEKEKTP